MSPGNRRSQSERPPLSDEADLAERSRIERRTREAVMGVWKPAHDAQVRSGQADDLTGAYRRETGRRALAAEVDMARRADGRLVLAFVDVDSLKEVNDREGHQAGDRILATVVRTLRSEIRSYDPIVRYGGDEFVCGLGGMDLPSAETRFESIGAAVEAAAGVTVSVGVAALGDDDTADDLINRADLAMLEVKVGRKTYRPR